MSLKKKLFFAIILLVGLVCLTPFFLDINKFKPQIQAYFLKKANLKVDFTEAHVVILSGFGVDFENVRIDLMEDQEKQQPLFQVKKVSLRTQLGPLLEKRIVADVVLDNPKINIFSVQQRSTTLPTVLDKTIASANPTDLSFPVDEDNTDGADQPQNLKQIGEDFLSHTSLHSVLIRNGELTYQSGGTAAAAVPADSLSIHDLNATIAHIGFDQDISVSLDGFVYLKNKDFFIKGPIGVKGVTRFFVDNWRWEKNTFDGELILDNLNIYYQDIFAKSDRIPAKLLCDGEVSRSAFLANHMVLSLLSLQTQGRLEIPYTENMSSNLTLSAVASPLAPLKILFPHYTQFLEAGSLSFSTALEGRLSDTDTWVSKSKLLAQAGSSHADVFIEQSARRKYKGDLVIHRAVVQDWLGRFFLSQKNAKSPLEGLLDATWHFRGQGPWGPPFWDSVQGDGTYRLYAGQIKITKETDSVMQDLKAILPPAFFPEIIFNVSKWHRLLSGKDAATYPIKEATGHFQVHNGRVLWEAVLLEPFLQGDAQKDSLEQLSKDIQNNKKVKKATRDVKEWLQSHGLF